MFLVELVFLFIISTVIIEMNKKDFYGDLSSLVGLNIDDNTIVFDELGIDGLDALEFMNHIASKYNVDMSSYKPNFYHQEEADIANVFKKLYNVIRGRRLPRKQSFPALHLYNVVQRRKWFDP